MKRVILYIAGKIDPNSSFGTSYWRDAVCAELSRKTGMNVVNIDPTKPSGFEVDQNNPQLVVGRNSFMQKVADITLVYLSDDISVGGSQEMLIAKYLKKPLIGLAPRGGKFNKEERELFGKTWKNYLDPYVVVSCDKVAETLDDVADYIKDYVKKSRPIKDMSVVKDTIDYYESEFYINDSELHKHEKKQ